MAKKNGNFLRAQLSKALLSTLHYPVGGTKCCVNPNLILELVAGQLRPTMANHGQLWSPFLPVSLDFQLCCYPEFLPRTFVPVLVKQKLCLSLFNSLFQPLPCPKGCSKQASPFRAQSIVWFGTERDWWVWTWDESNPENLVASLAGGAYRAAGSCHSLSKAMSNEPCNN